MLAAVARLKEKDATRDLREACAGAFGAIVSQLGSEATLPVVLKPLLPLLSHRFDAPLLLARLAGRFAGARQIALALRHLRHASIEVRREDHGRARPRDQLSSFGK